MDSIRKQTKITLVKNQKLHEKTTHMNLLHSEKSIANLYPKVMLVEENLKESEEELIQELGVSAQTNLIKKVNAEVESILSQMQFENKELTKLLRAIVKDQLSEALEKHSNGTGRE